MSAVESTLRCSDLKPIRGCVFVPVEWRQITTGDTIRSPRDGMDYHVQNIQKFPGADPPEALVTVRHGLQEQTVTKLLDEGVHVHEDSTGWRLADYEGSDAVRKRKGVS